MAFALNTQPLRCTPGLQALGPQQGWAPAPQPGAPGPRAVNLRMGAEQRLQGASTRSLTVQGTRAGGWKGIKSDTPGRDLVIRSGRARRAGWTPPRSAPGAGGRGWGGRRGLQRTLTEEGENRGDARGTVFGEGDADTFAKPTTAWAEAHPVPHGTEESEPHRTHGMTVARGSAGVKRAA